MSSPDSSPAGRPRNLHLDEAILEAAADLLRSSGYAQLSIEQVARAAGTTRPTVYRRYPDKQALVAAVLLARHGADPTPDTGTLEADLVAVQRNQVAFFNDPLVQRALLPLLPDLENEPGLAAALGNQFMRPRRASTHRALARGRARGEIPHGTADYDEFVCDQLTGPLLFRAIARGLGPIDESLVQLTVRSALAFLRDAGRPPGGTAPDSAAPA